MSFRHPLGYRLGILFYALALGGWIAFVLGAPQAIGAAVGGLFSLLAVIATVASQPRYAPRPAGRPR